ncbi:adaptor- protein complex 5, sigma 1 subunit [Chamberlinius hualienensis]
MEKNIIRIYNLQSYLQSCIGNLKMVYAFLIVSANYLPPKILFSQRFTMPTANGSEDNESEDSETTKTATTREIVKDSLEVLSQRITTEYNFALSVDPRNTREMDRFTPAGHIPELTTGMFIISKEKTPYYTTDKQTVWCGTMGLIFALILESNENRGLASIILKYVTKYIDDYVKPFKNHMEIWLKPHIIMQITRKLMPCGQLVFVNHKFMTHTERELEQLLKSRN